MPRQQNKEPSRSIRTSQLISPFGPGAIVDLGGESFACMDITHWNAAACLPLPKSVLSDALGKEIKGPPIKGHGTEGVPYARFPRWLFCPNCRRLYHYQYALDKASEFSTPRCVEQACSKVALVPMRFVVACEEGHVQDIDWYQWAHRRSQPARTGSCSRKASKLWFKTQKGADFDAMSIECECGTPPATFEGLTDPNAGFTCSGRQPWQRLDEAVQCRPESPPRAYPRGASNIYYPKVLSSLDLATEEAITDTAKEDGVRAWLATHPTATGLRLSARGFGDWRKSLAPLASVLEDEACRQFGLGREDASRLLGEYVDGEGGEDAAPAASDRSQHGILLGEWPFLARDRPTRASKLQTRPYLTKDAWRSDYAAIFEQVTLVDRLREVRALLGFARVKPEKTVSSDLLGTSTWLPGVESFGEGIFIKLASPVVNQWEAEVGLAFHDRSRELEEKCRAWGREPPTVYSSPRFIALHTLAHGLVRRLAFDAGYSSSSLRERIYCGERGSGIAGILVYTADSDSQGSLGGLVRQGEAMRLLGTLERTMADLSWCSADPVCLEMTRQGADGLNAAACHSCSLVAETSCMYNNSLLDRRLLVGDHKAGIRGLLGELVQAAS